MGNQATSFSYSLAPSPERHYSGLGTLYGGKKLSTAGKQFPPVSVFVMESGDGKGNLYAQEIKRLRCPDIVRFLDLVLMDQKIWLVTEAVMPFEAVKESLTYAQSILCIERMFHALSFLHSKVFFLFILFFFYFIFFIFLFFLLIFFNLFIYLFIYFYFFLIRKRLICLTITFLLRQFLCTESTRWEVC
jgi:hypothetical protein